MENKVKIGVLGYGVVGSGLIDIIDNNKEKKKHRNSWDSS